MIILKLQDYNTQILCSGWMGDNQDDKYLQKVHDSKILAGHLNTHSNERLKDYRLLVTEGKFQLLITLLFKGKPIVTMYCDRNGKAIQHVTGCKHKVSSYLCGFGVFKSLFGSNNY